MSIKLTLHNIDPEGLIEQLMRNYSYQMVTADATLKEDAHGYAHRIWSVPLELSSDWSDRLHAQLDFRANNAGYLTAVHAVVEIKYGVVISWTLDKSELKAVTPKWVQDLAGTADEQLKGSNAGGYSSTKPEAYRELVHS